MMPQADEKGRFRPRRSCLYMPGSNARALEKARTIAADVIIIDLEDAVAPDDKVAARKAAAAAVAERPFGHREVVVRINALDTQWGREDLSAIAAASPDAMLVPKIADAVDISVASKAMDEAGAPPDMALWVMIETPAAILNIAAIAAVSKGTRLAAFVMGTNDLAKDLRAQLRPGRSACGWALQSSVTAARAYGLHVIDGVFNDISDAEGMVAECAQGREMGFDGKTLIHPAQIDICNRAFTPTEDQISEARAIVDAFADPANAGQGVIKVDGKMTELLHLDDAKRTLAIAEVIAAFED